MACAVSTSPPVATTLAERLSRAMTHAGFNQKTLEERAGLTRGYLSRVLKGERVRVDATRISRLARACGVDLRWLSTGEGEMTPREGDGSAAGGAGPGHEPADNAFEHALAEGFRRGPFELADLDAVRRVMARGATLLRDEADLVEAATAWLRAAAALRRESRPVTVETLVYRMARPSTRPLDDGAAELQAMGAEGPAKPVSPTKRR